MSCTVKSERFDLDLDSNNSNQNQDVQVHEATNKSDFITQGNMSLADDLTLCHVENMVQTEYFIVKTMHSSSVDTIRMSEPMYEEPDLKTQQTNKMSEVNCSIKCVQLDTVSSDFEERSDDIVLNDHNNSITFSSICSSSRGLQSDCLNSYHTKPHAIPLNARCSFKSRSLSSFHESLHKTCDSKCELSLKGCEKDKAESFVINVDPAVVGSPESSEKDSILVTAKGNVFQCKKCDRSFPLEQLLNLHERNHTRERNFTCGQCDKRFYSKSDLHHHIAVHMDQKPFVCALCGRAFRRKTLLRKHELFHGGKQKMLSCTMCTKLFISEVELSEHMKVHKKSKEFHCNICKCSFVTKHTLRRHESRRHNKDSKFSCDYCREMFSSSAKLARHVVAHAGSRPFTCNICTKSFILSHHLSQHMGIHAPEKLFTCHHCARSYTRRDSLDIHMRIHTGVRPYGCSACFKTFPTNVQLTRHLRVHTER